MLPEWILQLGSRKVKSDSCGQVENQEQIPDFGTTFLADLSSNPDWNDTIERQNSGVVEKLIKKKQKTNDFFTLPKSFSPVGSAGKKPSGPHESINAQLKVEEMYINKDAPFEWTAEFMDLEKKVEVYNSIAGGMEISLHEDGVNFEGHIHVNMNLSEDVCVVEKPTVDGDAKSAAKPTPSLTTISIKLPPNTTEVIHIDSQTTTREMIVKLFEKLRMVNYPRKYILYEYEPQIDETAGTLTKKLTRISDDACPLKVVLNWPIPHCGRALVLMENRDFMMWVTRTRDTNHPQLSYFFQHDSYTISLDDHFERVAGLTYSQIDTQYSVRNGSRVKTYSKKDGQSTVSSVPSPPWYFPIVTACTALPVIVLFLCYYFYTEEKLSPDFSRQFLKKFVDEFLEKFKKEI